MADLIKGLDVSVIQGTIDFAKVAAEGVQFVICRCGVGNSGKDSTYDRNMANAKAAGLQVMAYHFVYPLPPQAGNPTRNPTAQAQLHAGYANGALAACDLEWPTQPDWAKWGCSAAQIGEWALEYLEAYESLTGIRPLVYTYPDFAHHVNLPPAIAGYPLWIASYASTPLIPAPWTDWALWQDTGGGGKLPNGAPVDTDKARDLSLWAPQMALPAPPVTILSPVEVAPPAPPVPDQGPSQVPPPAPVTVPVPAPVYNPNIFSLIAQILNGLFRKYLK